MSYDKQKSKLKSMFALEESEEVFNAKMQKGLDDMRNGRITPLEMFTQNSPKPSPKLKTKQKPQMPKNSSKD